MYHQFHQLSSKLVLSRTDSILNPQLQITQVSTFTEENFSASRFTISSLLLEFKGIRQPWISPEVKRSVTQHIERKWLAVHCNPRRLPTEKFQIVQRDLKYIMNLGKRRPSKSSWENSPRFLSKSDNEWLPCSHYRPLNKIAFAVPHLHNLLVNSRDKMIFSKTYFHIYVEEADILESC